MDEDTFAAVLVDQRMLLLAGTRLEQIVPHSLSDEFRAWIKRAHAEARTGALLFAATGGALTEALERTGIPAVELKGSALADDLYGDAALRAYADIDLLVPVDALAPAVDVARRFGWEAPGIDERLPTLHRWLHHPNGDLPVLELHWRIHWYETEFAGAALARSQVVDGTRRLEPIDQLAALLLFYARDGFAGLRLAADIGAWWDLHGSSPVASRIEQLMTEHPSLAGIWRTSLAAVAPVAGLPLQPLPASARPYGRRASWAYRLRNWDLRGDVDQIKANVTLVDGLLSPREGLGAFLRRHVIVPTSFLVEVYGIPADSRLRATAWRVFHALKRGVRYSVALWGLRRGRHWSPLPTA